MMAFQGQHQAPPNFPTPPNMKLWLIDNRYTNYVVWRALVHDRFKRLGLLRFIDGTEEPASSENPAYECWRHFDLRAKGRLIVLLDQNIVPADPVLRTCRDIWLELRDMFLPLFSRESEWHRGVYKAVNTGTSSEYMKLHRAALLGDTWAAKHIFINDVGAMVRNNVIARSMLDEFVAAPPVLLLQELWGPVFPEHTSPIYAREDVLQYLFYENHDFGVRTPYLDTARFGLLISAIDAEHFSSAIHLLLQEAPHLATLKLSNKSALTCLVSNQAVFGRSIPCNDRHTYYIPKGRPFSGVVPILSTILELFPLQQVSTEMEKPVEEVSQRQEGLIMKLCQWIRAASIGFYNWTVRNAPVLLYGFWGFSCMVACICCIPLIVVNTLYWLPWKFLKILGFVEKPKDTPMDEYALRLLIRLCELMKELPLSPEEIFGEAVLLAARLGVHVAVKEILSHSPEAAFCWDPISSQYIFHMAVQSRDQRLFSIIYDKLKGDNFMRLPLDIPDTRGNNILHLAAKLSPPAVLDKIPGSVLQIQHELRWFEEIGKITRPRYHAKLNHDGKTPKMIFIEEHKELKEKAEKWMKETASSCTIIAALIGTITFAAAITVPGGNDGDTGFPIFHGRSMFKLFAISDAISFITSVTSLLMFMEIMMSRYEAGDFMRHLPIRLFIGLGSMLISIMFMMLTFSLSLYLVFGQPRHWVLISVSTVTCCIVLLFAYLQGSIMLLLISSTYSSGFIQDDNLQLKELDQNDDLGHDPLDIS